MPSTVDDSCAPAMSGVGTSADVRVPVPRQTGVVLVSKTMNLPGPLLVSAADITRVYGEGEAAVRALDGVTVGFPKGRFTAIMGPSGSGKSTLMHILAGLDRPTSGSVVLDDVEITTLGGKRGTNPRRAKAGLALRSFNLLPVLDARENIVLPMSIAGRKPDEEWLNRLIDTV